jgi:hypothetical protein
LAKFTNAQKRFNIIFFIPWGLEIKGNYLYVHFIKLTIYSGRNVKVVGSNCAVKAGK